MIHRIQNLLKVFLSWLITPTPEADDPVPREILVEATFDPLTNRWQVIHVTK